MSARARMEKRIAFNAPSHRQRITVICQVEILDARAVRYTPTRIYICTRSHTHTYMSCQLIHKDLCAATTAASRALLFSALFTVISTIVASPLYETHTHTSFSLILLIRESAPRFAINYRRLIYMRTHSATIYVRTPERTMTFPWKSLISSLR